MARNFMLEVLDASESLEDGHHCLRVVTLGPICVPASFSGSKFHSTYNLNELPSPRGSPQILHVCEMKYSSMILQQNPGSSPNANAHAIPERYRRCDPY